MSPAGNHEPETVTASIDNSTGGVWVVITETGSRYELDLEHRTLRRDPGGRQLRRDGHAVTLHQIVECRIGSSAGFLICVEAGVVTLRLTSHVIDIKARPRHPTTHGLSL